MNTLKRELTDGTANVAPQIVDKSEMEEVGEPVGRRFVKPFITPGLLLSFSCWEAIRGFNKRVLSTELFMLLAQTYVPTVSTFCKWCHSAFA